MTKFDLRNHPKFKARVAKLEGNQFSKVLHVPLRVDIDGWDWFVACIGMNGAYLIVHPTVSDDGTFFGFEAMWTKTDAFNMPTNHHELVESAVLNWSMMHESESSVAKKRHTDIKIVELGIEVCSKVVSQETMAKAGKTFYSCRIQGIIRFDIVNPYHR